MVGQRPRPIIGKLSELLVAGSNHRRVSEVMTSPKSPLGFRIQSPKVMKNFDVRGVGLKIVAALENSGDCCRSLAVRRWNLSRFCGTGTVLKDTGESSRRFRGGRGDSEMESSENYTYVTYHIPDKSVTKVFSNGCEQRRSNDPAPAKAPPKWFVEDVAPYPTSDFLSSCHLCQKNLHGKDIYMYRGEKGFCSPECRSRQIMMDEWNEQQCRSEASKSTKVSTPAHNTDQIFATGILVI